MKITKRQLRRIIKEALEKVDWDNLDDVRWDANDQDNREREQRWKEKDGAPSAASIGKVDIYTKNAIKDKISELGGTPSIRGGEWVGLTPEDVVNALESMYIKKGDIVHREIYLSLYGADFKEMMEKDGIK